MSIKCGIVGLPNVGKSTLFNALTASEIPAENYPFCTIEPNVGIVQVPDERLDAIANIVKPKKIIPTTMEFVDIAGLVSGASKGEGLGNQFLGNIRETNAIAHVVRCFEDDDVTHVSGSIDPIDDVTVINTELALSDMEMVEKQLSPAKLFNQTRERFREGAERIEDWEFSSSDGDWEKGVEKTYVRAQDAMKKAFGSPSVENFHDWRKRVKYHRYHTKLLNELQPSILKGRENALGKLADTLGVEHDLSVLCETLSSEELSVDTGRLKLVLPLINRWQTKLRMESARLGECLFWEKSDWLLNRWKQYEKAYLREEARPDSPPVQFTLSKVKIA